GGELHQLTRDQTLAQELVDRGILRPEEAATHRLRHALTNALGGTGHPIEVQVQRMALTEKDQVLLCTDGLTEMVDNATIMAILQSASSASEHCHSLVEQALKNGGKDNVTVALARYQFPQDA